MVGQVIGDYEILGVLGKGGMGVVYKAMDVLLEKVVALKVINPHIMEDERFLKRFRAEARALGRLQHPNIVNVFTFRKIGDHVFIVMEYIEGETVTQIIKRKGALPWEEAVPIAKQTLNALAFAHEREVIHRDVKPSNIILSKSGQVKVMDFGLAKIQSPNSDSMLTRTGVAGGTLYYMPPEQLEGLANVDHRCDVYSLGMTLYQTLAGRTPFEGVSSEFAIIRMIDQNRFPPLVELNTNIPPLLADIVMKSLQREPDDRFESATAMREALDAFEQHRHAPPSRYDDLLNPVSGAYVAPPSDPPSNPPSHPPSDPSLHPAAPARKKRSPALLAGLLTLLGILAFAGYTWWSSAQPPAPRPMAALSVTPEPADASVFIQGRRLGPGPVVDHAVDPGQVNIRLVKEGYIQLDTLIDVAANDTTALHLALLPLAPPEPLVAVVDSTAQDSLEEAIPEPEPTPVALGSARIRSEPSGASISIDRRRRGQTPATIGELPVGSHRLVVSRSGYESHVQTITVREGQRTEVNAQLKPIPPATGSVNYRAVPFGDLYVNGKKTATGSSQFHTAELPVGTHTIRAVYSTLGDWSRTVEVKAGEQTEVLFLFKQVKVTIGSVPTNAEILIDGKSVGKNTPSTLTLWTGPHTISVKKEGYEMESGPLRRTIQGDLLDNNTILIRLKNATGRSVQ